MLNLEIYGIPYTFGFGAFARPSTRPLHGEREFAQDERLPEALPSIERSKHRPPRPRHIRCRVEGHDPYYTQPPRPPRLGGGFGRALTVGRLDGAERVAGLDVVGRARLVVGLARVVLGRARCTVGLGRADGELRVAGALRVGVALRVARALRVGGALRVAGALRVGEARVADGRRGCWARVRDPDAA